jgi:hypothetical protein
VPCLAVNRNELPEAGHIYFAKWATVLSPNSWALLNRIQCHSRTMRGD